MMTIASKHTPPQVHTCLSRYFHFHQQYYHLNHHCRSSYFAIGTTPHTHPSIPRCESVHVRVKKCGIVYPVSILLSHTQIRFLWCLTVSNDSGHGNKHNMHSTTTPHIYCLLEQGVHGRILYGTAGGLVHVLLAQTVQHL